MIDEIYDSREILGNLSLLIFTTLLIKPDENECEQNYKTILMRYETKLNNILAFL